ncbi:MAG: alpha/beta fold hydrolase [Bacteroidia bacterium]|nr:alpha/beta fold hydrolase [Bacteroidia bacterium]NNM22275.1 alpha/beta fold hydrolase [Flavobacteriaceae bacterium]
MPIIPSKYVARGLFRNGHFSTIYSAKLRPRPKLLQKRERIWLLDGDFMDLDWSETNQSSGKVAVLLHGLEGNAQRRYMLGQARALIENGWDACAVNYRGCSGVDNFSYGSYNAGKTDDLESVIQHIIKKDSYDEIALIGFSLGGNLILKYLGEGRIIPKEVIKGMAVSAPLSLKGSLEQLEKQKNVIYRTSFIHDLRKKYRVKMPKHPAHMNQHELKRIRSLKDFDDIYTAPAHGFEDAFDYYRQNSSLQFLKDITNPVLILNAQNDSFLSPHCYPELLASKSKNIYLETPKHGGHVGFHQSNETYYNEIRSCEFLNAKF